MKNILKGSKKLLFDEPNISLLGFLSNLGIVSLAYFIMIFFSEIFSISIINKTHVFSISYIIIMGLIYKTTLGENKHFNSGFILSAILTIIMIIANYLRISF